MASLDWEWRTAPVGVGRIAFRIRPRLVLSVLVGVVAALALLGTTAVIVHGTPSLEGRFPGDHILVQQFTLDQENNIPTWFSSAAMGVIALLATFAGLIRSGWERRHWLVLGGVFLVLSIDETASIHETFSSMIRDGLGVGGIFFFAWVIPAMVLVVVLGAYFLRFVMNLPTKIRLLTIAAGTVYLLGAVGLEMVGGNLASASLAASVSYGLITTVEETMEMIGLVLFIYALALQLDADLGRFTVTPEQPVPDGGSIRVI